MRIGGLEDFDPGKPGADVERGAAETQSKFPGDP